MRCAALRCAALFAHALQCTFIRDQRSVVAEDREGRLTEGDERRVLRE